MAAKKTLKLPYKKAITTDIVKVNPKRDWSLYQKNIFKDIHSATDHTVVIARAGGGKTSTIVEGFKYLPKGKKTLMVAFNKSIADELKVRAPSYVETLTLHSLGFRAIKQSFGNVTLDNNKARTLTSQVIGDDFDLWELNQSLCKCVSLCKGFLVDSPDKIGDLIDKFGIEIFDLTRDVFIKHVIKILGLCKSNKTIIDFDDMIWFPFIYRLNVGKFDVVFVDEAQDLNAAQMAMVMSAIKSDGRIIAVGDPAQCVDENTIVTINGKQLPIKDCDVGDDIICFNNGKIDNKKILHKKKSSWDHGYEIKTASGKTLLMSPNHRIWANPFAINLLLDQCFVYLIYTKDHKFLISRGNYFEWENKKFISNDFEKIWILDITSSMKESIYLEEMYSLQFGIPKLSSFHHLIDLYNDKNKINNFIRSFRSNGLKLLRSRNFDFNYPNWSNNDLININSHSLSGTNVNFSWKNNSSLDECLEYDNIDYTSQKDNLHKIDLNFDNYNDALIVASRIRNYSGAEINERLSIHNDAYLVTASSLHVGMQVYSIINGKLVSDAIVSIDKKDGIFYDIQVEQAANFIGNDILSHNSIYQFRGADSEAIPNLIDKLKAKTLPLSVTYRCPKKVVKLAQEVVPDIECAASASEGIVEHIKYADLLKMVKPGDFILSRTNAPLIKYCLALLKLSIPANIQGRDIGANLQYFIKKSKAKSIPKFVEYVDVWRKQEIKRLLAEKKDSSMVDDKAECLLNLCEGVFSIKELKETIDKLFNDVDDDKKVILSTTHKAKGLERDRVFVLVNTYRYGPGVTGEEANLWYVAITRARKELYLVRKEGKYSKYDDKSLDDDGDPITQRDKDAV